MDPNFAEDLEAVANIDVVPAILQVVCRVSGLGFAAVARVTDKRWIACAVRDEIAFGLKPGGELEVATTLCNEIRATGEPIVIDHVAEHPQYCGHPTPRLYGFQSYVSIPIIRRNGDFFGTLCAIDPKPATVNTPAVIAMFRLFAELIAFHLDAQDKIARTDQALLDAHRAAELREQFIAVLGHDLRSPLTAISAAATALQREGIEPQAAAAMAALIRRSAARMSELISDVMDFARGRLGAGIPLSRAPQVPLGPVLAQVVAEQRMTSPERRIEQHIAITRTVNCDRGRIAQLLSNLLANAIAHGDPAGAVRVVAHTDGDVFELSVANEGSEIPVDVREQLFEPFYRASVLPNQQGLGLGLYIASQIARAHGGALEVESSGRHTRFIFRMPIALDTL